MRERGSRGSISNYVTDDWQRARRIAPRPDRPYRHRIGFIRDRVSRLIALIYPRWTPPIISDIAIHERYYFLYRRPGAINRRKRIKKSKTELCL